MSDANVFETINGTDWRLCVYQVLSAETGPEWSGFIEPKRTYGTKYGCTYAGRHATRVACLAHLRRIVAL